MTIAYDVDHMTSEQRESIKKQYIESTKRMLAEKGITHDEPDHVSLGTHRTWVRVWLLVDTKEESNGKEEAVAGNPAPT